MQQLIDILTTIILIPAMAIICMALYEMTMQIKADRKRRLDDEA